MHRGVEQDNVGSRHLLDYSAVFGRLVRRCRETTSGLDGGDWGWSIEAYSQRGSGGIGTSINVNSAVRVEESGQILHTTNDHVDIVLSVLHNHCVRGCGCGFVFVDGGARLGSGRFCAIDERCLGGRSPASLHRKSMLEGDKRIGNRVASRVRGLGYGGT